MAHGWQEGLDLNKHPVSIYKMWLCPDVDVDKGHPAHILLDLKGHLGLAVIIFEQGMLVPTSVPSLWVVFIQPWPSGGQQIERFTLRWV